MFYKKCYGLSYQYFHVREKTYDKLKTVHKKEGLRMAKWIIG